MECQHCGKDFAPSNKRQRFCATRCRVANSRKMPKTEDWFYPAYTETCESHPTVDTKTKILQLLEKIKAGIVK